MEILREMNIAPLPSTQGERQTLERDHELSKEMTDKLSRGTDPQEGRFSPVPNRDR